MSPFYQKCLPLREQGSGSHDGLWIPDFDFVPPHTLLPLFSLTTEDWTQPTSAHLCHWCTSQASGHKSSLRRQCNHPITREADTAKVLCLWNWGNYSLVLWLWPLGMVQGQTAPLTSSINPLPTSTVRTISRSLLVKHLLLTCHWMLFWVTHK